MWAITRRGVRVEYVRRRCRWRYVKLEDVFKEEGRKTGGEEEPDAMVDISWAWQRGSQS